MFRDSDQSSGILCYLEVQWLRRHGKEGVWLRRGKAAVQSAGGFPHDSLRGAGCGDGRHCGVPAVCGPAHARLCPADGRAVHSGPHQLLPPLQVATSSASITAQPGCILSADNVS